MEAPTVIDRPLCLSCGAPLTEASPTGLCPGCRPDAAPDPTPADVTTGFSLASPGSVSETLADSVGTLPRVVLRATVTADTRVPALPSSSPSLSSPSDRSGRYQLSGEIA